MGVTDSIRQAGRQRVLISFMYDGELHIVEPYSFREKGGHALFMGYCLKCQKINAFHPAKMSSLQITDRPYVPRWEVEF
jgi:predicted DNA-binding transcriptional regulator YafY